jgi:hypothetical protein
MLNCKRTSTHVRSNHVEDRLIARGKKLVPSWWRRVGSSSSRGTRARGVGGGGCGGGRTARAVEAIRVRQYRRLGGTKRERWIWSQSVLGEVVGEGGKEWSPGAAAEAADLASSDSVRWAAAAPLGHDARGREKKRGGNMDRV